MELVYWHWLVLAIGLLVLEIMAPGVFFLWMSAAAAVVGVALMIDGTLSDTTQGIIFAVVSVATIVLWHLVFKGEPKGDDSTLHKRDKQLIGRTYVVSTPIVNGRGKIRVGDSYWIAAGDDAEVGTKVTVVSTDGVILNVKPA